MARTYDQPPTVLLRAGARYTARIETSLGLLVASLDAVGAPLTVNNFVFLAREGFYDGLSFHRVIKDFMCQAGCPHGSGIGGPGYQFNDELPKPGRYELGSLAMANAGPNTNGSQFFIISGPKGIRLAPDYSLFGKLIKGLDVLDAMQRVATGAEDRPLEALLINSITITEVD